MSTLAKRKYAVDLSWPPAAVFVISIATMGVLSGRYKLLSATWTTIVIAVAVLLLAYVFYAENSRQVGRAYIAAVLFVVFFAVLDVYGITHLTSLLVAGGKSIRGMPLLLSSAYFWCCNVLTFGLCYWLIDRGGPHMRAVREDTRPDFLFPEMTLSDLGDRGWQPSVLDYMYLAFTDATAFSPTDTLPLSSAARILMAIESALSLVVIALVTARAVNILT